MEKNIFTEDTSLLEKGHRKFNQLVFGNDVCASAFILAARNKGIDLVTDPSLCRKIIPSLGASENGDNMLAAGVQALFIASEGGSTYKNWIYTDFFFFNPDGTGITPGSFVLEAVAGMDESQRQAAIDAACNSWLYAMREIYGPDGDNLYFSYSTGEVSFGTFDLIPGTQRRVVLPSYMGRVAMGTTEE